MPNPQRAPTNPIFPGYFADPFVWEHAGAYYAVGTGELEAGGEAGGAGGIFPLLRSDDFVTWRPAGRALEPPDPALGDTYWAPEVTYAEGRFYLYYSVGFADRQHQLRVAAADAPLGPYRDLDAPLTDRTRCAFAIDPHLFQDDDGQRYLFYATDFLDCEAPLRAGTALVVDRLESMTRLAGEARVVLRARHDWQRFLAERPMYGGVYDWHTLEGPCVRKRSGRYYCLYSGGRWETESYGVDFGVADHVLGPYADACPEGPRVLRSVPGTIIGPGHTSIVRGPDGATDYIAYHAWGPDRRARRPHLDPLVWGPDGPRCLGPTVGPREPAGAAEARGLDQLFLFGPGIGPGAAGPPAEAGGSGRPLVPRGVGSIRTAKPAPSPGAGLPRAPASGRARDAARGARALPPAGL
ncbi:MAG TPA: glycoside hydrolase family 43 protein [Polyangiaceae bacterium]|nr:glycoside hydrolase family 43 protein [Polyangiaceae bacterium]